MKSFLAIGITISIVIGALFAMSYLDPVARAERQHQAAIDRAHADQLAPLVLRLKETTIIGLTMAVLAAAVAISIAAPGYAASKTKAWWIQAKLTFAIRGMYAGVVTPDGIQIPASHSERTATAAAVFTNVDHISTGAVKQVLNPKDPMIEQPPQLPPPPDLTPEEAVALDPEHSPMRLVIGQTGAGKTNTLYYLAHEYARQLPGLRFVICSTNRKDWPDGMSAYTPDGIGETIVQLNAEMQRRDDYMATHKLRSFQEIADPTMSPLALIVDEAEAIFDDFDNRTAAGEFRKALRNVARRGRNYGIVGIFGTQLARRDIFDATVIDNAGEVYMMRVASATAAQFAVYEREIVAMLANLPTGRAYCLRQRRYVTWPHAQLPQTPLSDLYREPLRALPGPADRVTILPPAATEALPGALYQSTPPPMPTIWDEARRLLPEAPDSAAGLTKAQRQVLWRAFVAAQNKGGMYSYSETQRQLWPHIESRGGQKFLVLRDVIREEAAARGYTLTPTPNGMRMEKTQ